jgi:hypothetical protein
LKQIDEYVFAGSGLIELLLPNSIHFLSGSAFENLSLDSISFWPGRCKFHIHEMFIEDIIGRSLIRYFGRSPTVVIASRIEIVGEFCFSECQSLTSITFEANSKLHRIEESAFAWSGLIAIEIPASVEVVHKCWLLNCTSLTSVTFESNSKLQRIGEYAFQESGLMEL